MKIQNRRTDLKTSNCPCSAKHCLSLFGFCGLLSLLGIEFQVTRIASAESHYPRTTFYAVVDKKESDAWSGRGAGVNYCVAVGERSMQNL